MEEYNYYIIRSGKNYVYKRNALVEDDKLARKFRTKVQAVQYAKKYLENEDYSVIGDGGIKEKTDYDYYQTRK